MTRSARAIISAGTSIKDNLRAAIQFLSDDVKTKRYFSHTGWRYFEENHYYLTSNCAIGRDGIQPDIEVDISSPSLKDYQLVEQTSFELKHSIWASLRILEVVKSKISYPLFCSIFAAPLGEVLNIDYSIFLEGFTGTFKSELAALCIGHYGKDFHGKNLPGSWESTANSLEKLTFLAKDSLMVIDDFCPKGSQGDISRYHRDADRLLRGAGNKSGRGRMNPDGSLKKNYFPRSLIICTGEDIPRGQSLRARMLILKVAKGDVNVKELSQLQEWRNDGLLSHTMFKYIQWIACKMDVLKSTLPQKRNEYRKKFIDLGRTHARLPEILSSLYISFELFCDYAIDATAIDKQQSEQYRQNCWNYLLKIASEQKDSQDDEDPVKRFFEILASAFITGQAHLEGMDGKAPESEPERWGWKSAILKETGNSEVIYNSSGQRLGWVDQDSVYLDGQASFTLVQRLASSQGSSLAIGPKTLNKRIDERNLIVTKDENNLTKRRRINGVRVRVLHINIKAFELDNNQNDLQPRIEEFIENNSLFDEEPLNLGFEEPFENYIS